MGGVGSEDESQRKEEFNKGMKGIKDISEEIEKLQKNIGMKQPKVEEKVNKQDDNVVVDVLQRLKDSQKANQSHHLDGKKSWGSPIEKIKEVEEAWGKKLERGINEVSSTLSNRLTKYVVIGGVALSLAILVASYTIVTIAARRDVRKYAEKYVMNGEVLNRIEFNQTGFKEKQTGFETRYGELDKIAKEQYSLIGKLNTEIESAKKENEGKFLSLEGGINEAKGTLSQNKKDIEEDMKDDYNKLLEEIGKVSMQLGEYSAKVSAVESELSKAKDLRTSVSSIDERLKKFVEEKGELEINYKNLKRDFDKLDKDSISRDDYKKLEDKINNYDKTKKGLQDQIDSLKRELDSYKKKQE